jgi:hypothetical protein
VGGLPSGRLGLLFDHPAARILAVHSRWILKGFLSIGPRKTDFIQYYDFFAETSSLKNG